MTDLEAGDIAAIIALAIRKEAPKTRVAVETQMRAYHAKVTVMTEQGFRYTVEVRGE